MCIHALVSAAYTKFSHLPTPPPKKKKNMYINKEQTSSRTKKHKFYLEIV